MKLLNILLFLAALATMIFARPQSKNPWMIFKNAPKTQEEAEARANILRAYQQARHKAAAQIISNF